MIMITRMLRLMVVIIMITVSVIAITISVIYREWRGRGQ